MRVGGVEEKSYILPQNLPFPPFLYIPDRGRRVAVERHFSERICLTCTQTRYKDRSKEAIGTFKTPTRIPSTFSALWVATHELQHVLNAKRRALQEEKLITATVTLHYMHCPECGRLHVRGGRTTISEIHQPPPLQEEGALLDIEA